ncbi:MAG: DUF4367 domain-containing protein [Gammaproteobacteria bacterium]
MDDQFMLGAWRRPRPDFARQVRERLDQQDLEMAVIHRPRPVLRAAAYAAVLLLAVSAFALPSVRAGAAAFLDLFRVVDFAPVAIDTGRMKDMATRGQGLDLPHLLGDQVQVLKQSGPPREVADAATAGTAAGIAVRMPAWLPPGMAPARFDVIGENAMRVNLNAGSLNSVLDALGIDDLRVPQEADGKSVTMNVPPVVSVTFRDPQSRTALLLQARQPQASFPAGADLTTIAEIGLRVLGLERGEAHRFAQNVDWRSTLLVPVPANVATFKQVDVHGNGGLLIETKRQPGMRGEEQPHAQLMWSSGGSVFVLSGNVPPEELFAMAQSVQ